MPDLFRAHNIMDPRPTRYGTLSGVLSDGPVYCTILECVSDNCRTLSTLDSLMPRLATGETGYLDFGPKIAAVVFVS